MCMTALLGSTICFPACDYCFCLSAWGYHVRVWPQRSEAYKIFVPSRCSCLPEISWEASC
uniref:Secreted protein n=1 Tax=Setaria viridis TaxID=4556 RepID=A0A4U6T8J3_SETVI|nr:hypothetical protein SEVIR_9G436650v2 [Setaria viridis]